MTSEEVPDPEQSAIDLFAAWLSRRDAGEAVEFEDLLRLHPRFATELEELRANWMRLGDAGDSVSSSGSVHARLASRFGEDAGSEVSLHESESSSEVVSSRISRLAARGSTFGRYR